MRKPKSTKAKSNNRKTTKRIDLNSQEFQDQCKSQEKPPKKFLEILRSGKVAFGRTADQRYYVKYVNFLVVGTDHPKMIELHFAAALYCKSIELEQDCTKLQFALSSPRSIISTGLDFVGQLWDTTEQLTIALVKGGAQLWFDEKYDEPSPFPRLEKAAA